jgi:hypothetical protein
MKTAPIGAIPQRRSSLPGTTASPLVASKYLAMVGRSNVCKNCNRSLTLEIRRFKIRRSSCMSSLCSFPARSQRARLFLLQLYEPYSDNPETRGFMRLSTKVLNEIIPNFLRDGWQVVSSVVFRPHFLYANFNTFGSEHSCHWRSGECDNPGRFRECTQEHKCHRPASPA